eukprot:TRINITY_DN24285_c0_g2_i1.p1 TRINITY_DN24285_c0_g2~~TRINITY_DN24285_c0_g2_i1.p1  ORF type:complete len:669 (-),score=60.46 TRINITY_DN24285_c0_g2_i1:11-2017(-)
MDEVPEVLQAPLLEDDVKQVQDLLSEWPDARPAVLRMACIVGSAACASATASTATDVLRRDRNSWTALHHAAQGGHVEVLRALLAKVGRSEGGDYIDVRTWDARISRLNHVCGGLTPLHLAAGSGEPNAVKLLLDAGADSSAADNNGWTSADHAQAKARILELLGTRPESSLSRADYDRATRERNEARAASLTASDFLTCLEAANAGSLDPLRSFLCACDTKNLRIQNSTLLQAATSAGSPNAIKVILEMLQQQGKPGHDPEAAKQLPLPTLNDLDAMGFAPLHTAAEIGFAECAIPLIEARADVNIRTEDASYRVGQTTTVYAEGGLSALHIGVAKANLEMVSLLLRHGADTTQPSSFGITPQQLAIEHVALSAGMASINEDRNTITKMLGLSDESVAAGLRMDVNEVKANRQSRQKSLQLRIAAEEKRRELQSRAEVKRTVRERYTPLDESVAFGELDANTIGRDVVSWSAKTSNAVFVRAPSVTASLATGVVSPISGVFVFQLISPHLCSQIWAETENYLAVASDLSLPQPTRHDGCLDLSHVFPELLQYIADAAMPAVHALLPEDLHKVSLRHAFRTKNYVGRNENFKRHVDKYAVTLNVCLHKTADVIGSRVFFYDSKDAAEPAYMHEHVPGVAVLHSSKEWHETEPLSAGERGSVIMWFAHN